MRIRSRVRTVCASLMISIGCMAAVDVAFAQALSTCGDRLNRLTESETNLAQAHTRLQSLQGELQAMKTPQGLDESSTDLAQRSAARLAKEEEVNRQQLLTEQMGGDHANLVADYNGTCIEQ